MKVISLFAGIGGFDLGFQQAGFATVAHVERDPQCRKLLHAKFPDAHAFYDVNEATGMNLPKCDVLCGGWPCQDLSVAGKRAGLAGARSGLFYQFIRIAKETNPKFIVWENVPGLLSSTYEELAGPCVCGWPDRRGGMHNDGGNTPKIQSVRVSENIRRDEPACPIPSRKPSKSVRRKNKNNSKNLGCPPPSGDADDLWGGSHCNDKSNPRASNSEKATSESVNKSIQDNGSKKGNSEGENMEQLSSEEDGENIDRDEETQQTRKLSDENCPECGRRLGESAGVVLKSSMGEVLRAFHGIGYDGAWRTLDAQYLGVAQRRRRVFGVFARRDIGAECCAEILSLEEGMRGHPAPRREAGKEVAGTIGDSSQSGGFRTTDLDNNGAFVVAGALDTNDRGATADKAAAGHYVCARSSGLEFWSEDDKAAALGTAARAVHESTLIAHTLRGEGFDASEDGTGRGTPLVAVSVALRGREGGAAAELGDECGNALRASQGGGDKAYVLAFPGRMSGTQCALAEDISISLSAENPAAVAFCNSKLETFTDKGIIRNASTQETHTDTILRILRKEIGEEEFAEWGLGILVPFYPPEVLQSALHGSSLRPAPFPGDWMVHISSPCPKKRAEGALRTVRSAECDGCSSPGSKLSEQLAEELGTYLSFLSQPGASQEIVMRDLWIASEGIGLLREALSAIQKAWESYVGKSESVLQPSGVRRLSPEECEFLQGFPRGYTAGFADSTRYRMLGNAVAVPVTHWIAQRLMRIAFKP